MASIKMSRLAVILVIFVVVDLPINAQVPDNPDAGNKCGGCPCNSPCSVPPSPPPPPPPVVMPPPPPKKPPSPNCPPPPGGPIVPNIPTPPSQYIYFTAPPGNLYPVDQFYNGADRGFTVGIGLQLLIGSILLAFW